MLMEMKELLVLAQTDGDDDDELLKDLLGDFLVAAIGDSGLACPHMVGFCE